MEAFFILLGLGFLLLPIIAIIVALSAKSNLAALQQRLQRQDQTIDKLEHEMGRLRQQFVNQAAHTAGGTTQLDKLGEAIEQAQHQMPPKPTNPPDHTQTSAELSPIDAENLPELPDLRSLPLPTTPPELAIPQLHPLDSATTSAPVTSLAAEITEVAHASVVASPAPEKDATSDDLALSTPAVHESAAAPTEVSTTASTAPSTPASKTAAETRPQNTSNKSAKPPVAERTNWLSILREWLFGGNLVAKMGLFILFFGVAFLLKYASERVSVPIELRLTGIVLADMAMLAWAWRIRLSRPGISLPVQGAALAIMMLVSFAAMRMYHLIPPGLAFFLLFALTAFTCLLAVLQNALWLALFGITGGFMVPIATSTGEGSHIGLFSYYLLLNAGVLAIAFKRSWRALNLVGLGFTFVIGTAWGVLRYQGLLYSSSQFFLIAFFLFYVAIAVLYARRQPPNLKGLVDGTIVFGTPLMGFGLQYGLVKEFEYGLAFSALALGLFYATLAMLLWQRVRQHADSAYRLLVESFLALAVVFGTLTIPLALDGRWTSAAWALEGAGIVWVGLRQKRPLTWGFGLLVQFGAWFSFLINLAGMSEELAKTQNIWLGFLLLAGASFMMACSFRKGAQSAPKLGGLATFLLGLATVWLVAGAWSEIFLRLHGAELANFLVASAVAVCLILAAITHKLAWPVARGFALFLLMLTGVVLAGILLFNQMFEQRALFDGPFLASCLLALAAAASSFALQKLDKNQPRPWLTNLMLAWASFWWFVPSLISLADAASLNITLDGWPSLHASDRFMMMYATGLALSGLGFAWLAGRLQWAQLRWTSLPNWLALTMFAIGTILDSNFSSSLSPPEIWFSLGATWLASEGLIMLWQRNQWPVTANWLRVLHLLRVATPWALLWPVGHFWVQQWLGESAANQELLAAAEWFSSGSWARYLPAWAMMGLLALLIQRRQHWPVAPLQNWYLQWILPLGIAWSSYLVVLWNLTQNGAMAPLPYLPLLNPLDLSTCFAMLLIAYYRRCLQMQTEPSQLPLAKLLPSQRPAWLALLPLALGYVWLNLVLLRSIAQYANIPYQFDSMFDAQLVQVILALVWTVSALLFMRSAVKQVRRDIWLLGASLLVLVVLKLFMVDLSHAGSIERIVSFVGVGLLMVGIGYLAPFPASKEST